MAWFWKCPCGKTKLANAAHPQFENMKKKGLRNFCFKCMANTKMTLVELPS